MLVRFSVENFKSFKNQTSFYMTAGRATQHPDHLVEIQGKRFLKGSFIFGANASGKSNFIEAAAFAHDIVTMELKGVDCDGKYFRIDEQYKTRPGVFQFDFLSNGRFYSYGFAISYSSAAVLEEWLYETVPEETCVFLRQKAEDGLSYHMESGLAESDVNERFRVYLSDFRSLKLSQVLFLSDVASRVPDDDTAFRAFRDASEWFSRLWILSPGSASRCAPLLICNRDMDWAGLLDYFDTGIDAVSIQNIQDGDLSGGRLAADHGNPKDLFAFRDESDGTKRLLGLLPIYDACRQCCVVLVDEIDRSLHTKLTQEFVRCYYQITDKIPCQLIAATHDANLMDPEILRQDEIWFAERKPDRRSVLFSLNRFHIRFDKHTVQDYLLGRYGGVPLFGLVPEIEPDRNEECAVE